MMTDYVPPIWHWAALRLREKAAEARWRETLTDHGTEATAPRVAAWRVLEGVRREVSSMAFLEEDG